MSSIGWLVIGTNRYRSMAIRCLETIKANYSGALESRFFSLLINRVVVPTPDRSDSSSTHHLPRYFTAAVSPFSSSC